MHGALTVPVGSVLHCMGVAAVVVDPSSVLELGSCAAWPITLVLFIIRCGCKRRKSNNRIIFNFFPTHVEFLSVVQGQRGSDYSRGAQWSLLHTLVAYTPV